MKRFQIQNSGFKISVICCLFSVFCILSSHANALTAEEVIKKSQAAFLYQGKDFKARVLMKLISKDGQERLRELTMLRKNYGDVGGEQKYFIYFFKPADVKDMTFMVYKYPARDDDRWLFIPALNMVKRIAAQNVQALLVLILPMRMYLEGILKRTDMRL